jgi:hypothetical protein
MYIVDGKPRGYWDKEKCAEEAKKWNTRLEFKKGCIGAFSRARLDGYLDEICEHMFYAIMPKGYWNKEKCVEESLKHTTRKSMRSNSKGAYGYAVRNGFIDEICEHMTGGKARKNPPKAPNKELFELHRVEALRYKTRHKFFRGSTKVYIEALRNKWIEKICKHMTK